MDDVLGLAVALGHHTFHLVGHDWGGQVAWCLAAHEPDRVRTLAVLSRPHPASFLRAMSDDPDQADRSAHHRSHQRPEATAEWLADDAAILRGIYERWGVPADTAAAYLATLGTHEALDAAINWYRAVRSSTIRPAEMPPITVPTLYVWGTDDPTVGRDAAEGTADDVTGPYRFEPLTGFGHTIPDEAAGVFTDLLLDHLATHADAGAT